MHHMARVCERYGIGTKGFSPEFFDALMLYDWPGNVRKHWSAQSSAQYRTLTTGQSFPLYPKHLPIDIRVKIAATSVRKEPAGGDPAEGAPAGSEPALAPFGTLPEYKAAAERRVLQALIFRTKGEIKEACRISGLSRSRLYALLQGIQHPVRALRPGTPHSRNKLSPNLLTWHYAQWYITITVILCK